MQIQQFIETNAKNKHQGIFRKQQRYLEMIRLAFR